MGNLVDCLKKAKRLNKYEKAAIRAAQQEYLPNAKTSAEADQMAVNSAIAHVQDIISSIYQQAGVPQSRPVVVPASGPLVEPVTPTAVAAPAPEAVAPSVAPETKRISPNSKKNRIEQANKLSLEEYKAWRLGDNPIKSFDNKTISEAVSILRETEGDNKYLKLIDYLISKYPDTNVGVSSFDTLATEKSEGHIAGYYDPVNHIALSRSNAGGRSYSDVLAHEFIHALTTRFIVGEETGEKRILNAQRLEYKNLEKLYNIARKQSVTSGLNNKYGLTNLKEFVSEAFSNQKFQEFLDSIPTGKKGTLWSEFVDAIRSILGIAAKDGSLLKEVIKASETIFNYRKGEAVYTKSSYSAEDTGLITKLDDEYKLYKGEPVAYKVNPSALDFLETENNPSVDPNKDQEALPSSAANGVTLDSNFFPPSGKKIKNSGVANLLKDVMSEFWGKVITSGNITQRELDIIIRNGVNEFKAAFADSKKSAADWYSTSVEVAMEVASLIHPELNNADVAKSIKAFSSAEDPVQAANLVMRMAMAITSQNLAVTENTAYANEQYETFVKTGKFNPNRIYGEKAESISGNLELANTLIEKYGFTEAEKFIRSTYSVKDLSKLAFDITGNKKNIDGYIDDMVQGAAIFGPKIGQGFLQNLMGNFDPVTIDLWMRRTWGRWTGDVVGDGVTPERLAKLLDAANKAGIPVPNELKNVKVITAKRGNGNNYRTIANDTVEILSQETDESTNFRDVINKFAKEVNADWQRQYKLLRQNVTPEIKAAVEAGELSLKQVVDEQSAFFNSIPKKPKEANLKEWRKQQYELAGRTEVIESDALKALKPKWAKAAKVIISNLNPIDQPSNLDRRVISKVVNEIRETLKKEGIDVTNADVQAVLWYPEKDIWAKLRGEQESNLKQSYDEEFIKIATERGLGEQANQLAESIRQKRAAESVGTNRAAPIDTRNVEGTDQQIPRRNDGANAQRDLAELDLLELPDEEVSQTRGPVEKGSVRGISQSSLLDYEYAAVGTDEDKKDYGQRLVKKYGDDFVGALSEMRQIENPAVRSVAAATILDNVLTKIEQSKVKDPYLESMYERLLSDVETSKTGAGQALQAENVVNDILRKHLAILAYRGVIKSQLKEVQADFDPNASTKLNDAMVGAGEKAGRVITESKEIVDPKIKEINDLIKAVGNILKPKKATDGLGQQIMDLIHQSAGFRAFYTNKGIDGLAKNFWQLMAGPQAADGNIVTFDRVVTSELGSILRKEMEKAGYENANKPNLSTAEKIAMFLSNDPLKADKIQALDDAIRSDIAQKGEEEGAHLEELWDSIMGTMIESSSSEVTARRIVQETIKDLKLNWNDIIKGGKASIDSAKVSVINGVLDKVSKVSPGGSKLDLTKLQAQLGPIFDEIASVRQNRFDKTLAMAEARKVANEDPKVQALSIIDKLNKQQSFVGPNEIPKANPLRNAIADYLNGKITTEKFQEIMTSLGLPAGTTNSLLSSIDEQKSINEAWKQIDKSNDLSEFLSKYENYLKPIRSIARNLGINLKEVFTGSTELVEDSRRTIQTALENNDKFNALSEKDKASLAENFYKAWEKIRGDIAQKEFHRLIPIITVNKNAQVRDKLNKAFPRLIEYSNLGLLTNDQFLKALGEQYGIKQFDSDVARKLMDLSKKAESLPQGSERNAVYQQIMDTIMEARGSNWRELASDYWFRNVMSAPRTALEIFGGGILQGAARTMLSALDVKLLKENPMMALRFIGMFAQDVSAGARLGLDLIMTGDRSISPRFQEKFFASMNKLEKGKSPGGYLESTYRNATGLKKVAAFPYEMLGRVLTALDYVGGQGIRSNQMLYAALVAGDKKSVDALMKRFDSAEVNKARAQARKELGPNPRQSQVIVRTREILSEGISDDIKAFGNHMTEVTALNAPPIGIGGVVYRGVSQLPLWIKAPSGLAFAKSALSLAQEISNWTPVLGQINYARTKIDAESYGLKGKDLNEARARQIFTAQALGLAVSAAAASAFLGHDDDEDKKGKKKRNLDITGGWNNLTPDQKKALRTAGEMPYSVIINGKSYDYKQFPFVANLAMIGHWRDQERFNNKKWDAEDITRKVVDSWIGGVGAVKDLSMTSQLTSIFGMLSDDNKAINIDTLMKGLISSAGNAAVGLIPFSSGLREVDNWINQERYRTDFKNPGLDMFLSQVPFVRGMGGLADKPMFNALGDNVQVSVTPFNRHIGPDQSLDPVTREFSDKIAMGTEYSGLTGSPHQITDTDLITGKVTKRDMTFEETYDYDRAVLRAVKRQITSDLEAFKSASPKEASNYLDAITTHFKSEVSKRMNTKEGDFRQVPVDKNFSSTLTPEYNDVLMINAASAPERELKAQQLSLDKQTFMRDRNMMNISPENRMAVLRYAISPSSYRNELQKKISNMAPSDVAAYVQEEIDSQPTAADRTGYIRELAGAGLLTKSVLLEMAKQKSNAR